MPGLPGVWWVVAGLACACAAVQACSHPAFLPHSRPPPPPAPLPCRTHARRRWPGWRRRSIATASAPRCSQTSRKPRPTASASTWRRCVLCRGGPAGACRQAPLTLDGRCSFAPPALTYTLHALHLAPPPASHHLRPPARPPTHRCSTPGAAALLRAVLGPAGRQGLGQAGRAVSEQLGGGGWGR